MRLLSRVAVIVLTIFVVVSAAFGLSQSRQFVRARIAGALASMGLANASFTVSSVDWDRLTLSDLELAPDLYARRVEIDYQDPSSLLHGEIDVVTVRGARWTTSLDALEGSTPARLLARREDGGGATPPGRIRIVQARVSLPELALTVDADLVPSDGGFSLSARTDDGRSVIDASGDAEAMVWRLDASVPPAMMARMPSASFDGELRANGHGSARLAGRSVIQGEVTLSVDGVRLPSIAADFRGVRASLAGEMALGAHLAVRAQTRSSIAFQTGDVPGARIRGAEISGALQVDREGPLVRAVVAGALDVRVRMLAVGPTRATELRFGPTVLVGRAQHGQPIVDVAPDTTQLALSFAGRTALRGVLHASSAHLDGDVRVRSGERGVHASIPIRLAAPAIRVRDGETTLADVRADLPLSWDENGRFSASGSARASALAWRDVDVGPVQGSLDLADEHVALDWIGMATEDAQFRLRASIATRTTIDIEVPVSEVSPSDAFHRALGATAGLDVRGRAGGELHLEPGSLGLGTAILTLDGASIDDVSGRGGARGARGALTLASLDPVVSADADHVAFTELHLGHVIDTRDGSARIRFERSGMVTVEDGQASIAGGHLYAGTFGFMPRDPNVALSLRFDGLHMDRLAGLLAEGRVRASGLLDGHLSLRVHLGEAPSIVLGDGVLVSRGSGHLSISPVPSPQTAPVDLEHLATGSWIQARVLLALADFEYSLLTFDIDQVRGEPCLHASVTGHGTRTPQEVELTVAVEDIQLLVDQSLRFWTARDTAPAHT